MDARHENVEVQDEVSGQSGVLVIQQIQNVVPGQEEVRVEDEDPVNQPRKRGRPKTAKAAKTAKAKGRQGGTKTGGTRPRQEILPLAGSEHSETPRNTDVVEPPVINIPEVERLMAESQTQNVLLNQAFVLMNQMRQQQLQQQQPRTQDTSKAVLDYTKAKPVKFDGRNIIEAVDFLYEVEKKANTIPHTDTQRVQMVEMSMTGDASEWFRVRVKPLFPITWDQFKPLFKEHFLPFASRQ